MVKLSFTTKGWLQKLTERLPLYLNSLQVNGQTGHYQPAISGLTPEGAALSLAPTCFAIKMYTTLDLWKDLHDDIREEWIEFVCQHQTGSYNAFVDPVVISYLKSHVKPLSFRHRLKQWIWGGHQSLLERVIHAETKQAIATLAAVNASPRYIFDNFPQTSVELQRHLQMLDWSRAWSAGAHTATIAVFLQTQANQILPYHRVEMLINELSRFIEQKLDLDTGAYFNAKIMPEHGEIINGAMKILTTLDWLREPIHQPQKLIDTCLKQIPLDEGCHITDAIYVLYRCFKESHYKKEDIQHFCIEAVNMIQSHYVEAEGGFSYFIGKSQTSYYGVPITIGEPVADIHGTLLLTWALSMIFELLEDTTLPNWHIIRP